MHHLNHSLVRDTDRMETTINTRCLRLNVALLDCYYGSTGATCDPPSDVHTFDNSKTTLAESSPAMLLKPESTFSLKRICD